MWAYVLNAHSTALDKVAYVLPTVPGSVGWRAYARSFRQSLTGGVAARRQRGSRPQTVLPTSPCVPRRETPVALSTSNGAPTKPLLSTFHVFSPGRYQPAWRSRSEFHLASGRVGGATLTTIYNPGSFVGKLSAHGSASVSGSQAVRKERYPKAIVLHVAEYAKC